MFGAAEGDRIVFEWPAAAGRPGLYALRIGFANTTGKKTVTRPAQSPDTCELGITDQLALPVLHFAVLPPPPAPPLTFELARVDCVDLTNPEFIPDDIAVVGSARVARIAYDTSGPTPEIQFADAHAWSWDGGDHLFFRDGGSWSPEASVLDPTFPSLDLGLDHVLHVDLRLAEIEGDFDRGVLKAISLGLVIAVCLLLTALIAAIATIVIVLLIVADLASETLATPVAVGLIAFVVAVAGGLIGGVWGAVFPATLAAAAALIDATVDSVDVLIHEHVFFTGSELALQMSPWRYHDKLWVMTPQVDGNGALTLTYDRNGVSQTFDAQEPGALRHWQYRMRLDVMPE